LGKNSGHPGCGSSGGAHQGPRRVL